MPRVTDRLVLPEDIVFAPVSALPQDLRRRIDSDEQDVAVSRPRSRTPSKVVTTEAADLLKLFQEPMTIAEAVVAYCEGRAIDPQQILTKSFPLVREFVNDRFLLPESSPAIAPIESHIAPGDRIGDSTVVCRVQVLADTEILQARYADGRYVAIKMAREEAGPAAASMLAREARILRMLDGGFTPRLMNVGVFGERRAYMVQSWCEGSSVAAVAAELRSAGESGRQELLRLCQSTIECYARLHQQGVLHADVHPGNVLVGRKNQVWLIDFGLAQLPLDAADAPPRGGVAFFFDPEYADSARQGRAPTALTFSAEQYSVAALVYHLLTGAYTHDFSLERHTMLRQIVEESPLAFERQGVPTMPEVETVLTRALGKATDRRFPDLGTFARAFANAVEEDGRAAPPAQHTNNLDPQRRHESEFLARAMARCGWESELFREGPTRAPRASVNYGSAGIAWFFYRLAQQRDDAEVMALADVWIDRALVRIHEPEAFYNEEIEITEANVGRVSPFHAPSGIHAVGAMIADARGDIAARDASLRRFVEALDTDCDALDVTTGWCGAIVASALLSRAIDDRDSLARTQVLSRGRELLDVVWSELEQYDAIPQASEVDYLGAAHGWAGFLYAALAWAFATGDPVDPRVGDRLDELAGLAELVGRGARWPWRRPGTGSPAYMPGWCNGTAGYVFLWTLAYRVTGDDRWQRLAEKAAWNTYEDPAMPGSLCCGLTGRAYALLNWYKVSGDEAWVERANSLASMAIGTLSEELLRSDAVGFEHSLYKGELGLATLLVDLERPDQAVMPLFEVNPS